MTVPNSTLVGSAVLDAPTVSGPTVCTNPSVARVPVSNIAALAALRLPAGYQPIGVLVGHRPRTMKQTLEMLQGMHRQCLNAVQLGPGAEQLLGEYPGRQLEDGTRWFILATPEQLGFRCSRVFLGDISKGICSHCCMSQQWDLELCMPEFVPEIAVQLACQRQGERAYCMMQPHGEIEPGYGSIFVIETRADGRHLCVEEVGPGTEISAQHHCLFMVTLSRLARPA